MNGEIFLIVYFFLEHEIFHSKIEQKIFAIYSLPLHIHCLPHYQNQPDWHIYYKWWTYIDIIIIQRP